MSIVKNVLNDDDDNNNNEVAQIMVNKGIGNRDHWI